MVANNECINIPAIYYFDGYTEVIVGHSTKLGAMAAPDYTGMLETPGRRVLIFDAKAQFAEIAVPGLLTRIEIWINHPTQPDHVTIAWSDASAEP